MNRKVLKFGGVCMSDSKSIKKAIKIIKSNTNPIIVVSAPGARDNNDIKITDLLYECNSNIEKIGSCDNIYSLIEERFNEILKYFKLKSFKNEILEIKNLINKYKNLHFTISRGEYIMAKILAKVLKYEFIDASKIIKFYDDGTLNKTKTYLLIEKYIKKSNGGVVIPGFYGALPDGEINTFSRDGTDYTASLIAAAVNAKIYENWKDVDGLMSANPKLVENTRNIREISFTELRELSYLGSKILHPDTVIPLKEKNIPLIIKSIYKENGNGTLIQNTISQEHENKIKAITGKENCTLLKLKYTMENNELDKIYKVLQHLQSHYNLVKILVYIDEIILVVKENTNENMEELLLLNLKKEFIEVNLQKNISQVSIVGKNILYVDNIFSTILNSLIKNNIIVYSLSPSSTNSISLCVRDIDYKNTICSLNEVLFSSM